MSKITSVIGPQNFEAIRDVIGVVLADELANQNILQPNPLLLANVYVERGITFDKTELPAINISMNNADYDTKFRTESSGEVKYYIEVETNKAHSSQKQGDEQSALDTEFLAGKIRAILEHPAYAFLNNQGIVMGTKISSIQIGKMQQQDAQHTTVARLQFDVRMIESNGSQTGVSVAGIDSEFFAEDTNKGYKIITNNS
jgi:hypothetical protein